ncbi:MAG: alkaline phosphatase [Ilumatobacter sp.]|uniref:alkaline phosphatase n=1 Tax=Ilumatobacter sp. TaxID=1967498 RepID=UPI0026296523|nr:alkaline phosphatase [Ilumatobacter sp.]MDJ0767190.1 alkaline phosphatase [Ilumatobacter sp.]
MMAALTLTMGVTALSATSADAKPPATKNVIVMIADGWGYNHVDAASYFEYGKPDRQLFNRFPVELAMSTYMAYEEGHACSGVGYDPDAAWADFAYVTTCATDSAAAATTMSTGVKTDSGTIGLDIDDQPLVHALERAEERGMATGVVTSVQLSHATPAGFVAHNVYRGNYADIANEMIYDSATDVVMGAGHPFYDDDGLPQVPAIPKDWRYVGGDATWWDLAAGTAGGDADGDGFDDPWLLIDERAEFQGLMSGPTPARVFGVAPVEDTLQLNRGGDYLADPFVVPFIESVPTLEEMTAAALNILDDDPDGMFLMVEGGAVDWASHGNYGPNASGRMIEEFIDFERSVETVVDWVKRHSNWGETLLIVTGDHETGYLNGPGSDPTWEPIVNNGAGTLPGMEWHSPDHTNSLIPLFAKGAAARMLRHAADYHDGVRGPYLDNTQLAEVLFTAIG